jgi:anaphase-promoting complex subunit 2
MSKCPSKLSPANSAERPRIQNQYADAYHRFRQDKKLKFYHQGTVAIEVQLQDRQLSLEVTILQASVLEAFAKRGQ